MKRFLAALNPGAGIDSEILGINARNRTLVYAKNPRRHFPLADDKLRTKEILQRHGVPVPATLHAFRWMHEVQQVPRVLADFSDFVIKPSQGKAGSGIVVIVGRDAHCWLDAGGRSWAADRLARHIGDIVFGNYAHGLGDRAIVEERIAQAALLGGREFNGLPDIRVLTLDGRIVMAMLRIPTSRSRGKANLHQGAIGVGVDVETGETTHASVAGRILTRHPDVGDELVGKVIVQWPAVLDLARRAAAALPLGFLGIDVAVDVARGPLILEVNVRPGLEIQNANARGLRPRLDAAMAGESI